MCVAAFVLVPPNTVNMLRNDSSTIELFSTGIVSMISTQLRLRDFLRGGNSTASSGSCYVHLHDLLEHNEAKVYDNRF